MKCLNTLLKHRFSKILCISNRFIFWRSNRGFKRSINQENLIHKKDLEKKESFENVLKFYSKLFNMNEKEVELFLPKNLLWQSLTYKTYFHGKYPYNEKLAFQGRIVLKFHISLKMSESIDKNKDIFTLRKIEDLINSKVLGELALEYGILEVLRWNPAYKDIMRSGLLKVASESLCAIVGAIFLYRGGAATKKFIEEKIFIKNNILEFNNHK